MEDYSHINETLFASQEHSPQPTAFPSPPHLPTHTQLAETLVNRLVNNTDFWFPTPDLGDPGLVRHELFQQMHRGILTQVVMVHTFGNIRLKKFFEVYRVCRTSPVGEVGGQEIIQNTRACCFSLVSLTGYLS